MILKYIPLQKKKDFIRYVLEKHNMTEDEISESSALEGIAGEYLFIEKKEKKSEKIEVSKSEKEVFESICNGQLGGIIWEEVTEVIHSKVKIPDSVIPVYALEVMYGDELGKRIVMRDHKKSLRFLTHVCDVWLSPLGPYW